MSDPLAGIAAQLRRLLKIVAFRVGSRMAAPHVKEHNDADKWF
jgi:hypothetical protein